MIDNDTSLVPRQMSDLNSEMRCSILSNPKGELLILHENPLHSDIEWVEFDVDNSDLFLIYQDGITQNLGIEIQKPMARDIRGGNKVQLAYIKDKKIQRVQDTSIVIQDY